MPDDNRLCEIESEPHEQGQRGVALEFYRGSVKAHVRTPIMRQSSDKATLYFSCHWKKGAQLRRPSCLVYLPVFAACFQGFRDLVTFLLADHGVSNRLSQLQFAKFFSALAEARWAGIHQPKTGENEPGLLAHNISMFLETAERVGFP